MLWVLVGKKKFCAPDQIGKTKISGSVVPGSFKIFQNLFESLGFIHILISCLKNQQLNQTIWSNKFILTLINNRRNGWHAFVGSREQLLAKSLPNRPHHKGCVWAHESRADLEPLRFSTHERSGVGSESGLPELQFSRFFSLIFPLNIFGHK